MARMGEAGLERREARRQRTQLYESVFADPTPYNMDAPTSETYYGSPWEAAKGAFSGGIFGTDPDVVQGGWQTAGSFGGMLAREAAVTTIGAMVVPGSTLGRGAYRVAKYLPNAVIKTGSPTAAKNIGEMIKFTGGGALAGLTSATLEGTDPVKTTALYAAIEGTGAGLARRVYNVWRAKKKPLGVAGGKGDEFTEGIGSEEEMVEFTDKLKGDSEYVFPTYEGTPSGGRRVGAGGEEVGEGGVASRSQIDRKRREIQKKLKDVNKTFKDIDKVREANKETFRRRTLKTASEDVGLREMPRTEKIIEGAGRSYRQVSDLVDDLDGLTQEEIDYIFPKIAGTNVMTEKQARRILYKRSDVRPRFDENFRRQYDQEYYDVSKSPIGQADDPGFSSAQGTIRGRSSNISAQRKRQLDERVQELNDDLYATNIKTYLGMDIDSPLDEVLDESNKILNKMYEEQGKRFQPSAKELTLQSRLDKQLADLQKLGVKEFDRKMADAVDFTIFSRQVDDYIKKIDAEIGLPDGDRVATIDALNDIKKGVKNLKDSRVLDQGTKDSIGGWKPQVAKELGDFEDAVIVSGSVDELPTFKQRTEGAVIKKLQELVDQIDVSLLPRNVVEEIDKIKQTILNDPAASSQVNKLPEIQFEMLLKDRASLESAIENSGDESLKALYHAWRASKGDTRAYNVFKKMAEGRQGKINTDLAERMAERERVIFSDKRLKEDVEPIGQVGKLTAVTYKYKGNPQQEVGFIADQVEKIYPEAIEYVDGYKSINYDKLEQIPEAADALRKARQLAENGGIPPEASMSGAGRVDPEDVLAGGGKQQPPGGETIGGQVGELVNRPKDLDPFRKYLRSFRRLSEDFIRSAGENPVLTPIFQKARDLADTWQHAYQAARLDYEDINNSIDEFVKNVLKPDTDTGKIALDFTRGLDETLESVRKVTKKNFEDQAPATKSLYNKVKKMQKDRDMSMEEALHQIELEEVARQTPEVQEIYRAYRKFDNDIYEKYNAMVQRVNDKVDTGAYPESYRMKPISKKAGHAPIMYDGDLMVRVTTRDSNNNIQILFSDHVYGREQAHASLAKWLEDHKNLYGSVKGQVEVIPKYLEEDPNLNALVSTEGESRMLFGQDAGFIDEQIAKNEFRPDNLHEVFFAGTRPRILNQVEKRIGIVKALKLRSFMANKAIHFNEPRIQSEIVARALDEQGYKKFGKYIRTYANDQVGISRGLETTIDETVNAVVEHLYQSPNIRKALLAMGITPNGRNTRSLVRGLTFMGRAGALGINIGTALINTMLFGTNVIPLVGFKHAASAMANAPKIFAKNSAYQPIFKKLGINVTSGALGHMENLAQTTGAYGHNLGVWTDWVDNKLMWAFNRSEDLTRGMSAVAFRDQADEYAKLIIKGSKPDNWRAGKLEEIAKKMGKSVNDADVLDEYAYQMVLDTNFIFDLTDAGELFRNVPLKPFLQFKNFFVKELEFIFDTGSKSKTDLFKVLGAFTAIGGTMSLPGLKEIDAISRFTFNGFSPMLWAEEHLPDVATGGLPVLAGTNISRKVALGEISYLGQNKAGIFLSKLGAGWNYYRRGEIDKARLVLTPNGLRGLMESYELASTGGIKNPYYRNADIVRESSGLGKFIRGITTFQTQEEVEYGFYRQALYQARRRLSAQRTRAYHRAYQYELDGRSGAMNRVLREAGIKKPEYRRWVKGEGAFIGDYLSEGIPKSMDDQSVRFFQDVQGFN